MNEQTLVALLVLLVFTVFVALPLGRKFHKKLKSSWDTEPHESVKVLLGWAVKNKAMQKRLLVSLGVMMVVFGLDFIPMPGLDWNQLSIILPGSLFPPNTFSLFTLGIMPFLTACLILQLFSVLIPPLRRWIFGDEIGGRKLRIWTYGFTLLFALWQSYGIGRGFFAFGIPMAVQNDFLGMIIITLSLTCGVMVLLGLAKVVERYGIGNGVALVFITPLLEAVLVSFLDLWRAKEQFGSLFGMGFYLLASIAIVLATFLLTRGGYFVSLSKPGSDTKVMIPLRISLVAREPFGWASILVLLPATLATLWPYPFLQKLTFLSYGWIHWILMALLIVLVTYLYGRIVFSPRYFADLMNRFGFQLNEKTNLSLKEFWSHALSRVLRITVPFLIVILMIQMVFTTQFHIPQSVALVLSGTKMLILVGVFYDILCQIQFFKNRELSGRQDWKICGVALDEMEAKLKAGFLESQKIPSLVEPLRFTWGMPIRTIVDQYRIYCPEEYGSKAHGLLNGSILEES